MPASTTLLMPQRHVGGALPYLSDMGVDGAHNTVGENVSAYNTALVPPCQGVIGYSPTGVQGTVLGIVVDLSALPYFLRLFPGPYRAGVPGRLVPVGSECACWRKAVSRGLVHPQSEMRVGVGSSALARPFGRRGRSEAGWRPKRALRSERWAGVRKRAPLLLGQTFRSMIGSSF